MFRLSGTGTAGATLRLYVEGFESRPGHLDQDVQEALRPLVLGALELSGLRERTGRDAPTVIT